MQLSGVTNNVTDEGEIKTRQDSQGSHCLTFQQLVIDLSNLVTFVTITIIRMLIQAFRLHEAFLSDFESDLCK